MGRSFAHWIESSLLGVLEIAAASAGWESRAALGARAGALWRLLDRRRRRVALANVRRAFPSWSREQVLCLVRENFSHLGRVGAELLGLRGVTPEELLARCRFEGLEHLEESLSKGRGAMLLTGHVGNWELAGLALGARGFPLVAVGRTQSNPWVDRRATELRGRFGGVAVPHREAVRPVLRALRGGRVVAFLMDQRPRGSEAVPSRFFGRTVATNPGLAAIALRTGAPVVPGFAVREGAEHWIRFEPEVEMPRGKRRREAIAEATAAFDGVIETAVRRSPEQWLWVHRRWRLPREWRRR